MKRSDRLMDIATAIAIVAAVSWFGSGFVLHLWKTEVTKAAMQLKINQTIDPDERLWILEQIQAELESNHIPDPDLWELTVTELVNRPDREFKGIAPGRLEMLRRLYEKLKIGTEV